jgi:hypothetical protein
LKTDGTCEDCDEYFHPDQDGKNCIQCDMTDRYRDIWTITGECFACPDKTYPGPEKHECIYDECDNSTQYLKNDGTCFTCDEWYYPAAQECKQDSCLSTEVLRSTGKCETCEGGKVPALDGISCVDLPPPSPPPCPAEAPYRTADGITCVACEAPYHVWNETTSICDNVVIYGRDLPDYSYVYEYTNKTIGNITYPEYNITTTKKTGTDSYSEQDGKTCPCDLEEFTTGEHSINLIVEHAVESAVQQQAKADYDFYEPLLVDPESVPAVGDPSYDFVYEKDDYGVDFFALDGEPLGVDTTFADE